MNTNNIKITNYPPTEYLNKITHNHMYTRCVENGSISPYMYPELLFRSSK